MNNTAVKNTGIVLLVTLLWVLLYQLNMAMFHKLLFSTYVTWIFLPSGIRLLSVIIFGRLGVLGLFIGALITYYLNGYTLGNPYILATISAVNPYLAVAACRYLLKIDDLFTQLSAGKLLFFSLMSVSIFSSALLIKSLNDFLTFSNTSSDMSASNISDSLMMPAFLAAKLRSNKR